MEQQLPHQMQMEIAKEGWESSLCDLGKYSILINNFLSRTHSSLPWHNRV